MDENQDGQVTWSEVMRRRTELHAWLAQGIALSASGDNCDRGEADLQASRYADGLYLSAMWTAVCPSLTNSPNWAEQTSLNVRYSLIFDQDNLHRGLLKVVFPSYQSSALLSPDRPETQISAANSGPTSILLRYLLEGVWHIWIGIDHIVFLLSLLVLAPLQSSRQRVVFAVVTAFTVAHSITLGLTITGWLTPQADLVEPAIALSVVLAALNNLLGFSALLAALGRL